MKLESAIQFYKDKKVTLERTAKMMDRAGENYGVKSLLKICNFKGN